MALQKRAGGYGDVMRAGDDKQYRITIATHDKAEAEARKAALARVRDALVGQGRGGEALALMRTAAKQESREAFDAVLELAGELPEVEPAEYVTFEDLATAWSSGVLHKQYPDYVKHKKSADKDVQRLAHLCKTVGSVPLVAFTALDFKRAMKALPPKAKRPAARRQYAQVMAKVIYYAVEPCGILERNPLPKGLLPRVDKDLVFTYLYPDEDRQLLACVELPVVWRLLWGFLAREGLRFVEGAGLEYGDIDRRYGTVTIPPERTKNGRGLQFKMSPGTLEALDLHGGELRPFDGVPLDEDKAAELLLKHLGKAGCTREALHESKGKRRRLRCHDLRATYITLALMRGVTEGEIMQHTGHRSSNQIHTYDHNAKLAATMGLGQLERLDVALGAKAPGQSAPPAANLNEPGAGGGVTLPVTLDPPRGATLGGLASEPSMKHAGWPLRESNPDALERGILKPPLPDATSRNTGNSGTSGHEKATDATECHTLTGGGVTPADAYLAALRVAAHAAVEAGNWTAVGELGALIDRHTKATASAPVTSLASRRRDLA